jgi:hypothetical protein
MKVIYPLILLPIKKVKVISNNSVPFMNTLELGRREPGLSRFLKRPKVDKVKVLQEP